MDDVKTAHADLHSERGVERGDRPGRAKNPVIKVEDLAWLEFEKPDLDAAERFAHAFGFVTAARTADTLYLRGARVGTHSVVIRKGARSRFVAPAFKASERADVHKLATANNASVRELRGPAAAWASTWSIRPGLRCGWSPAWRNCRSCRGGGHWCSTSVGR